MKIAILGSNSQIAGDLIRNLLKNKKNNLFLFTTNKLKLQKKINKNINYNNVTILNYNCFYKLKKINTIINFIGVANPVDINKIKNKIIYITKKYDDMVLEYLSKNLDARYIFISSGIVYGKKLNNLNKYTQNIKLKIDKENRNNWYMLSKINTENRHRNCKDLKITDLRIFNYFSHTINLKHTFFINDLVNTIINDKVLITNNNNFIRDFIHPLDFAQLIKKIMYAKKRNFALDCYSLSPVDKVTLLKAMKKEFNLKYKQIKSLNFQSPTSNKYYYYAKNKYARFLNYKPRFTSLQTILNESKKLFSELKN